MTKLRHSKIEFGAAQAFVSEHHRHHTPPVGHLFSLGSGPINLLAAQWEG